MHGVLVSLSSANAGDALNTTASSGATTLSLYDVSDFDEDGGWVTIAGNEYQYDTVDMDADTIHLTSGISPGAAVDVRVDLWDNDQGVVVSERTALVTVDGQDDGDPLSVDIDHSLVPLLAQGTLAVGQSVTLVEDGDGYRLVAVHGKTNLVTQTSTANRTRSGVDNGLGGVYGLIIDPDGTTIRIGVNQDLRVKTPDEVTYKPVLASAFTVSSDSKVKTKPTEAPDALAIIAAAPAKHWRYLSDEKDVKRLGPMADDLPEWLAQYDEADGHLMLDLARGFGVLWAAFGQQLGINAELRARVEKLEKGD